MAYSVQTQYADPNTLYHNGTDGMAQAHATVFNQFLEKQLGKANNFAREILGDARLPILGSSDERPKRCCTKMNAVLLGEPSPSYGRGNTYISQSQYTIVGGGGGGRDDTARALCMLGTMVFIAASAVLGYCYANYQNTNDEIKEKDRFQGYLNQYNISPQHSAFGHLQLIKDLFHEYSELLKDRLERDRFNCYTAVVVLASAATLAVGGAMSSSALMIVGGSVLVATTAMTAFKLMYECQRVNHIPELAGNVVARYNELKKVQFQTTTATGLL